MKEWKCWKKRRLNITNYWYFLSKKKLIRKEKTNVQRPWKFSWTQYRDTDSYSDADSIKHDFDLTNEYWLLTKITSIYISRPFKLFQIVTWGYFSVAARSIRHSLFYNGHFSIRWTNWNYKLLTTSKQLLENIIFKLLPDVIFPSLLSQILHFLF